MRNRNMFRLLHNGLTLCIGTYSAPRYSANRLWSKTFGQNPSRVGTIYPSHQHRSHDRRLESLLRNQETLGLLEKSLPQ